MRASTFTAWISAAGLTAGLAGCGTSTPPAVSAVGPQKVSKIPSVPPAGPYVAAGTSLTVRMDQPLDTYYTPPGSAFTATVVTSLRDSSGQILVAEGAKVHGTFASFGNADEPRVRLALQTIESVQGPLPISAAVRQAQHGEWAGPPRVPARETHQLPFGAIETGTETAGPSDPSQPSIGYGVEQPRQIHVPAGALLGLQLTAPLVAAVRPSQP